MYLIKLPNNYTGERYGVNFIKGEGTTDDKRLVEILKKKGFKTSKINISENTALGKSRE